MVEGSKVLLVDDSPDVIEILSDFLNMNGCKVSSASTGRMATEMLDREEFEIVILDVKTARRERHFPPGYYKGQKPDGSGNNDHRAS